MRIFVAFSLIVTAIAVAMLNVNGSIEEEFLKAYGSADPSLYSTFQGLDAGPISNWLKTFKDIAKCIENEIGTPDICIFNTTYDPFYYVQKCAKGTLVQKVIDKIAKSIPTSTSTTGMPKKVSKDRCLSVLPSVWPFTL